MGQVYLCHVACNDHLRVPSHTCEKHTYLGWGSVLCLIEYHYSIAECSASHKGEWCYLNDVLLHHVLQLHLWQHVFQCVVEWLTGDRPAFTDKENNVEIRADWCSGSVAMTGCSYGGTLPYEVATTGVKGLKTIIPVAGISNWYDYTNSQGVSRTSEPHYTDHLSAYNAGSLFLDDNWTVPNEEYGAYLKQLTKDERAANGNYEGTWTKMDYSDDYENIACSALIVHGLNDFNVLTKQSDLMYKAFKKAGQNVKVIWHQDGHNILHGRYVGDELYDELANKWLSHYLYDVKNGIEDMAEVMVQSNVDGTYKSYDSWGEAAGSLTAKPAAEGETEIKSGTFDDYYVKYGKDKKPEEAYCEDVDAEHAATYTLDVPAGTTIYGIPEVHVKLKTPDVSGDNLMVTAKLIDTSADGKPIKVYLTNGNIQNVEEDPRAGKKLYENKNIQRRLG